MAFALAATLAIALAATGAALHADEPMQVTVLNPESYPLAGGIQPVLDLAASALLPGYAFAQVPDSTPPTFDSSELDSATGVLTITFSETIDAANIVPARMHVRESGTYTGGVTLTAPELVTVSDGTTVSFTLTTSHRATVAGLATPELTIEPGAVRDASGNSIVGTFDASTRSFVDATSIATRETSPQGMAFSSDGTKMFIIGSAGDDVNEYDLSAPFDASTRSFVDATSISAQETSPHGIAFSSDGAKMFVIGLTGADVNEYALSIPFDASTRSFVDATSISEQEAFPTGIAFSSDGAKMFIIDSAGDDVNEYYLSAPFDASTRSFVDATSIATQETNPTGIAFSNDGAKMFVIGGAGAGVNEYALSTPFDASTRSFVDATSIATQEINPTGIAFSNDGTRMFIIGSAGDDVNEYELSPVHPIVVKNSLDRAFITTWNVTSSPHTIHISVNVTSGGDLHVDWGDGNTGTPTADGIISHTYQDPGRYQVAMTGNLTRINLGNPGSTASNLASIDQWGTIEWSSMANAFRGASNMTYGATDAPDLSGVTDMSGMFSGASSFNGDISSWDVSKVTDMSGMFSGASSFNHPLGTWDVSSVTDMLSMLDNAALFRQNLGAWYVVLDDAVISGATETLDIRAQNSFLDGQSIVYDRDMGGDSGRFIVNAAAKTLGLDPNGVHHDGTYRVIVTSTGGFGTDNRHAVAVTVEGIRPAPRAPDLCLVRT